jgi:uncharacterized membrane protein
MRQRLVFVDLLRGWATIVMIEVHVFNAFIIPSHKEAGWYSVLNYVNGLVAPSFIFIAGFVFIVSSQRKLIEFREFGPAFRKQLQRIGLVWVIGYLLHLPYFSLHRTIHETDQAGWLKFFQSDVLHCIALGLLVLFAGRLFIRADSTYRKFLLSLGTVIIILAPFVWDIDFSRVLPAPVAAYMNGERYSQFPIFPWLGFMMYGGFAASAFVSAKESQKEKEFIKKLSVVGASVAVGGRLFLELPLQIPFASMDVRPNTFFFLERLGIVFLLLALCWRYAERREVEKSWVLDVSKESLFVYAGHLLVIYGMFFRERSLSFMYGGQLNVLECIAATLGLMIVMTLAAQLWNYLKSQHAILARGIWFATVFLFSYLYLTR